VEIARASMDYFVKLEEQIAFRWPGARAPECCPSRAAGTRAVCGQDHGHCGGQPAAGRRRL